MKKGYLKDKIAIAELHEKEKSELINFLAWEMTKGDVIQLSKFYERITECMPLLYARRIKVGALIFSRIMKLLKGGASQGYKGFSIVGGKGTRDYLHIACDCLSDCPYWFEDGCDAMGDDCNGGYAE